MWFEENVVFLTRREDSVWKRNEGLYSKEALGIKEGQTQDIL